MRDFVRAMADRDYPAVCAGLLAKVRAGLTKSGQTCSQALERFPAGSGAEARSAANGTVTAVRIGSGNAFVLFRPAGSRALNYFVMTVEDGRWKSLGLSTGVPIEPDAASEG
jgi:hypothetical protein